MENFLELCQKRRSVRAFTPEPVKAEDLDYIMECVRIAPSAVNFQPWRFHLVKAEERELIQQCYTNPWFLSAKEYVIACVDHNVSWHRKSDGKDHADVDVAIAVEHFCLAVAERGLGTCWVCNFDAALCKQLFALPDNFEPVVFLPLGYPDPNYVPREFKRMAPEDLWF